MIIGMLMVEELSLGGTAINGKIENGIYYLGTHGVFTQVSQKLYFSLLGFEIFTLSILVTSLVGAFVSYFLLRNRNEYFLAITKEIIKNKKNS